MTSRAFDLAIVGAGIVGLAHAYAAARLGKKVIVIDRDARANGASIRNFGFITVTGQERGAMWRRAMRTSRIWREIAAEAGIARLHDGLLMTSRRAEGHAVLQAYLDTEMGDGCELIAGARLKSLLPHLPEGALALKSPHETRVESRDAIPQLAQWLSERWGVEFRRSAAVGNIVPPRIETSLGVVEAEAAIVCPGDDLTSLYPAQIAAFGIARCKLQMLRLADPGHRLPAAIMSDLGLLRYAGYAALPQAEALRKRLEDEQPEHLHHGIHLIAVQSADGSLVVGDSHHTEPTPDPFEDSAIEKLILDEYAHVLGAPPPVIARWSGTYAVSARGPVLVERVDDRVRLVIVTSGTGASIAFALAEEVISELYDHSSWKDHA